MRRSKLAALLAAALGGCVSGPLDLTWEASAAVSQSLCSKVFISRLDPETVYQEHVRREPGMGLVAWALRYEVDRERGDVRTRIAGGFERRSLFRAGRGCTLTYEGVPEPTALPALPAVAARSPDIAGPAIVAPTTHQLSAALDAAFSEPEDSDPPRATKAIVVVHEGRVIGERYAQGYGPETALLSHSIAKSVVNALIGILTRQSRLVVSQPAPIAAWSGSKMHAPISLDHLLRMNAGFGFDEGGGPSPATRMWYLEPDTAKYAAAARPSAALGSWGYSSLSYVLLSRVIGDAVGGSPQAVRDFAERELFGPLGMRNVTLEFDSRGTLMGANALFATPRDFARFGLLYLHDGRVGETRVLPEGWVDYSTRPTGDTGYGAGFWLNTTHAPFPKGDFAWGLPGAPADAFMARGYLGQYIVIVPSADLVIVRFGASHARGWEYESVGRLVHDVIAALPRGSSVQPVRTKSAGGPGNVPTTAVEARGSARERRSEAPL